MIGRVVWSLIDLARQAARQNPLDAGRENLIREPTDPNKERGMAAGDFADAT